MSSQRSHPIFKDISFNPNPVEQFLPMEPLDPAVFDQFNADGWTYWSDAIFRQSRSDWRGHLCRVVLLRIDLQHFALSKSQRRCLRRNQDLQIFVRPIHLTPAHEELFRRHAARFDHNRPNSISGFLSLFSSIQPCEGLEFAVYQKEKLLAMSFGHAGQASFSSNYCVYDPAVEADRSLGTFTMLAEIEWARRTGKRYYYPGFVYDLPTEFDYKLNFNALEYFDWWGNWYPLERLAVRRWREGGE